MKHTRRFVPPLFLAILLSCCVSGWSQKPAARLSGSITGTARAVLAGSRIPHADRGQDLGVVSPEMVIPGITLVFKRSPAQQEALEELLAAQGNPASPLYHQWLTPDTFAARFGIAEADIAATETWLQSHGFHMDNIGRDRITFSGTAAQVQSAFGADLHHYQVERERHFAPASDLTLPAELAPLTAAVLHLSDFRPKPSVVVQSLLKPQLTAFPSQGHYLAPPDILTMYGLSATAQKLLDGKDQGIAVVGQSYVDAGPLSEVNTFQTYAETQTRYLTTVLVPGSGVEAISPGDQGESEIDLEYASGTASLANVMLVYVGANKNYSVFDAIDFAITQNIAPVVSISYGACESLLSATELNQDNALFQQAAAQGQTLVAASGDTGSTACANYSTSSGVTVAQQQALAVSFPASSPYVTAVGGTQMAPGTFAGGSSPHWLAATGTDPVGTLLSYVPEVVWNEGSATRGIIAGGGGTSGYFPRPSWQSGVPGIPSGAYRLLPDVALQSSLQAPGFVLCTSDPVLRGSQSSCTNGLLNNSNQYTLAGGTSFATPIFAGMIALLNQEEQTTGQGNINPTLYNLASNPATYVSVFHDITSGTIACVTGAPSCGASGQSAYAATPGYDEATGLGSFDFAKLMAAWPVSRTLTRAGTTLEVDQNPPTASPGAAVPFQVVVVPLSTINGIKHGPDPSGTVSISVDGVVVQSSVPLAPSVFGALVPYTITAPSAAGSHMIAAIYSGDTTYSPSIGNTSILVGNVIPSGTFSLAANNLTIVNGATGTDTITITPASGYSGRLTWALSAASVTSGGSSLTACYGIGSPAVNGASTATLTIGVGSACTASSSSGSVRTFVSTASPESRTPPWNGLSRVEMCAGLLLLGTVAARRKSARLPQLLTLALLTAGGMGLAGCGGSSSTNGPVSGTTVPPPVAAATLYTLTLKGTDSVNTSITASTTFTLSVN